MIAVKLTQFIEINENDLWLENVETGETKKYNQIERQIKAGEPWNIYDTEHLLRVGEIIEEEIEYE